MVALFYLEISVFVFLVVGFEEGWEGLSAKVIDTRTDWCGAKGWRRGGQQYSRYKGNQGQKCQISCERIGSFGGLGFWVLRGAGGGDEVVSTVCWWSGRSGCVVVVVVVVRTENCRIDVFNHFHFHYEGGQ